MGWAETIFRRLKQLGVRVEIDNRDRTIGKKIHLLSQRKITLIAIVGEREASNQMLDLRSNGAVEQQEINLAELEHKLASLAMP